GSSIGKGTQYARLANKFRFYYILVGDLLRKEAACPMLPYYNFIPKSIKKLLLRQAISRAQSKGKRKFLLDKFPRSILQAVNFKLKICKFQAILFLECSKAELRDCLQRR
ncbi:uncharacterized protein K460DRAFT_242317, partial [Cucurbitaria berberidis CBS 394.84]